MRVAVIGRTKMLLEAAKVLLSRGHQVPIVWTSSQAPHYDASVRDFEALATYAGAEFRNDREVDTPDGRRMLRDAKLDIGVSINCSSILGTQTLQACGLGVLNVHAGDLPRYRGNACANWAILQDEPHVAVCVHLMVPELDAGPVVLRDHYTLSQETYICDVNAWFDHVMPPMLVTAAEGLFENRLTAEPQSGSIRPLRAYPRRPEDARIDWNSGQEAIHRLIRASSRPLDGAFTLLNGGRKVVIWRAEPHPVNFDYLAVPGQVCFSADEDPVVATGNGMLRLTDIEIEGEFGKGTAKPMVLKSLRNRLT